MLVLIRVWVEVGDGVADGWADGRIVRVSWYFEAKEMFGLEARQHPEMYVHLALEPDGSLRIGDVRRRWGMENMYVSILPSFPSPLPRMHGMLTRTRSSSSGARTGSACGRRRTGRR